MPDLECGSCGEPIVPDSSGGTTPPGASCDAPLFVHVCSSDVEQLDVEHICDLTTDTWWTVRYVNNVEVGREDSGTPCDEPPPADEENYDECVAGFRNIVFYSTDAAGVRTETGRIITGEACNVEDVNFTTVRECRNGTVHSVTRQILEDGTITEIEAVDTAEACGPVPQLDVEVECIGDEVVQITYTDGVETARAVIGDCVPGADIEQIRTCDPLTNTIHIVTSSFIDGALDAVLSDVDTQEVCPLLQPGCVESQSYTFAIDNTGTSFNLPQTFVMGLNDGSSITIQQTPQSGNTPQMLEWESEIVAGALALGITGWDVGARVLHNFGAVGSATNDVTNIGPLFGLPGPSSVATALALDAGGMYVRYMNIEICPGGVLPVSFFMTESNGVVLDPPRPMVQAGPVLGPILKFRVCAACGEEPVYYEEDGVTLAVAPPACPVPCGTSQLTPSPSAAGCDSFLETACDNMNSENPLDWISKSRLTIFCPGQPPSVAYYEDDGFGGLLEVELEGTFVDCVTGVPIPLPEPDCTAETVLCDVLTECAVGAGRCTADIDPASFNINTKVGINEDNASVTFAVLAPWTLQTLADELNASGTTGSGWSVSGGTLCTDDASVVSLWLASLDDVYPLIEATGEPQPALATAGCLDQDMLDKLCEIEANTAVVTPQVSVGYVCSDDTNTWLEIVSLDGVAGTPTDTGVPCSEPIPDPPIIEAVTECRNGFVTTVFYEIDGATQTEIGATATVEPCAAVNTHLIEGCIDDGNGDPVSAFTIVDDAGDPLFPPRPLTDLGFRAEGCC